MKIMKIRLGGAKFSKGQDNRLKGQNSYTIRQIPK